MRLHMIPLLIASPLLHADGSEYQIRPAPGGEVSVEVAKTGLYAGKKHRFLFSRFSGRVRFNREDPASSSVEFTIESSSVVCTDTWVNSKDLKKIEAFTLTEMLQVATYPQITFASSRVVAQGAGEFEVQGVLTIRGVSKPTAVRVKLEERSGEILSVQGSANVKLRDYGLKPPTAALGAIGTRNEIRVGFALTARASQVWQPATQTASATYKLQRRPQQ